MNSYMVPIVKLYINNMHEWYKICYLHLIIIYIFKIKLILIKCHFNVLYNVEKMFLLNFIPHTCDLILDFQMIKIQDNSKKNLMLPLYLSGVKSLSLTL